MGGDYKVSVELAARVGNYLRGFAMSTKATGELEDAQRRVSKSSDGLARSLTEAGAAGTTGAAGLRAYSREVARLERAERKLADTRRSSGPAVPGGLPGGFLPDPRRSRKAGEQVGESAGAGVAAGLRGVMSSPVGIAAVTVVGTLAAPVIGATIAGGILAAVGGAGIGAGIAAAVRTPQVKTSLEGLKDQFGELAGGIGADFADEVDGAIGQIRRNVASLTPQIRSALAPAAGYIRPLVDGFDGLVRNALPGLEQAVAAAGPVFEVIGRELPNIGEALGGLFETMADHSGEAASAVQMVLQNLATGIDVVAAIVDFTASWYRNLLDVNIAIAGVLKALPGPMGDFWEDHEERFRGLRDTVDEAGSATGRFTASTAGAEAAAGRLKTQQVLLNGSMHEGITAAGGLRQALDLLAGGADVERAEIAFQQAIDGVTESIKENGRSLDVHTEKGRANRQALLGLRDAAVQRAEAAYEQAGGADNAAKAEQAAAAALQAGRSQLIKNAMQYGLNRKKAVEYADAILGIPKSWSTTVKVNTGQALAQLETVRNRLVSLDGKTVTTYVRVAPRGFIGPVASEVTSRQVKPNRYGSAMTAMAAGGVASIYPASNPPLVKFAEPETGGEGYIPKNGSRARNLAIMREIAKWPSVNAAVIPMAAGGVQAAARGLVSVAGADSRTLRLDSAEAAVSARNAVASLNVALKENGRSFALASQKGRENRSAVYSAVRAAQDAARAKFEETGNVRLANAAYDGYIDRLRRALAQQKINAATVNSLLSVAQRPTFAGPGQDSSKAIAFTRSAAGALDNLASLRDTLSLNKATVSLSSPEGRENLLSIIGFLEAAGQTAQDRYTQTGNAKQASRVYQSLVAQLRGALGSAGYSKALITALISQYGRIALQANAAGGVYDRLTQATALPAGDTLYQWREPSTGGEAFVPRRGDRARAERVMSIAAGWHGGTYVPAGAAAAATTGQAPGLTVNNYGDRMTLSQFQQYDRQAQVRARAGRPR